MGKKQGFSLIEIVIVSAIIGVLAVVSITNLFSRRGPEELNSTTKKIVSLLREAQNRSISQASSTGWGVHFENSTSTTPFYALFASSYTSNTIVGYYSLPPSIRYSTSSIAQGNSLDISFTQITGLPSNSASIVLELLTGNNVSASSTIVVESSGVITN